MTSPVLRIVALDSSPGSVDAFKAQATTRVPDVSLGTVALDLYGGAKGLVVNSEGLCGVSKRAIVRFQGHNGARFTDHPLVKATCAGNAKVKRRHRAAHHHRRNR